MTQKQIVRCFSQEIILSIRKEIDMNVFVLLVDDCNNVSKNKKTNDHSFEIRR